MPRLLLLLLLLAAAVPALAQLPTPCATPATFTPCDFVIELNDAEAREHPDPYRTLAMHAEFRSPRNRTFLLPAFSDGGRRLVIRFSPVEPGDWVYKLTSNLSRFDGQEGKFTAAANDLPGFVRAANVHHWAYTGNNKGHLWMGDTCYSFLGLDDSAARKLADSRARQKFNHLRLYLAGSFISGQPDPAFFRRADERIRYLNTKGITADLILASDQGFLENLLPQHDERERYIRYLAARYAAMDITWQVLNTFDDKPGGRAFARELGLLLKQWDPYAHPRTSGAATTSSPLLPDGWMNYVTYRSADDSLGAVEHQLYQVPFVNSEFGLEDSTGTRNPPPSAVDSNTFRHRLWNATMNGQYPTFGNTATYDPTSLDLAALDSPGIKQMTIWRDLFEDTRFWELEPYFDVDGGRALALEGIEYIVYVEKPSAPVEVSVEKHGYDVAWIDPATGERIDEKKFKGEQFVSEAPNRTQDWVLHIAREGRKEGMLRSYKFDSRPVPVQVIEQNPSKVPFTIAEPAGDEISISNPPRFSIKITRQTRATRRMTVLWTGEVVTDGQGARVLATGSQGTLRIPSDIARSLPAVLSLHVSALNANGKAYAIDRVYSLQP